ncbi:MAG: RNase H family protein, partial [Pseudomonadota bacterium]|nr:RNase H family protein [Pseudomonadota bacterium]
LTPYSSYLYDGLTTWIHGRYLFVWITSVILPVKYKDLWQALDAACARHEIEWRWVKGHAGDEGNERADELARLGAVEARVGG